MKGMPYLSETIDFEGGEVGRDNRIDGMKARRGGSVEVEMNSRERGKGSSGAADQQYSSIYENTRRRTLTLSANLKKYINKWGKLFFCVKIYLVIELGFSTI